MTPRESEQSADNDRGIQSEIQDLGQALCLREGKSSPHTVADLLKRRGFGPASKDHEDARSSPSVFTTSMSRPAKVSLHTKTN
jgi:hypothetical protein